VNATETMPAIESSQDELYQQAANAFGSALERLAHGYEANAETRRDLVQEIHIALWRSFGGFDGRCSLRTWVYRVAHNVSATHVLRQKRARTDALVGVEELENLADPAEVHKTTDHNRAFARLTSLIQSLKPLDRQVILSYLEGLDAASIGEITGLSAGYVATKIHRIKKILVRRFHAGGQDDE